MKYTEGPWRKMGPIVESNAGTICDCRLIWTQGGDPHVEVPQSEANAKLIATAPELLERTKALIFFYEQFRSKIILAKGYPDPSGFIKNIDKYIVALKDAIKKAEGDL